MKKQITKIHRNFAKHIMLSLSIPNNSDLVLIFGNGDEANNLEAMAAWVQKINIKLDLHDKEQVLCRLNEAAKEHIEHAMDLC
ncbi:MAG: hypothetical protein Q9N62_09290 [Ghiorsea sp.]|nr:hypothetical protein [Ghiorsea sp.]